MAFPVVQTSATSSSTSTSHAVTMPSGIAAGDRLIAVLAIDGSPTIGGEITTGWTQLSTNSYSSAIARTYWRIADGTEGASQTLTTTTSVLVRRIVLRISGHDAATPPEISTVASGTSTAPNPTAVAPSWGALDTLWIPLFMTDSGNTVTAYPETANNIVSGQGSTLQLVALCTLDSNTASFNAGAFTITSAPWVAYTIAVRPDTTGAAIVTPAAIARVVVLPTPTILAASNLTPAVIPIVASLPTPTIAAAAQVAPAVIPIGVTLPTPNIFVQGGPVTVTPAVIAAIAALPTPIVSIDAVVTPAGIAIVVTVPNPAVLAGSVVEPATIPIIVSLPSAGTVVGTMVGAPRRQAGTFTSERQEGTFV